MTESEESSSVSLGSDRVASVNLHNKAGGEEKGFAPIDIEIQIQNERILAIFTEAITKTEIAVFLSLCTLKEVNFDIRKVVTHEHFEFIRKVFKDGKLHPVEPKRDANDDDEDDADDGSEANGDKTNVYKPITDEQIQEIIAQPDDKMLPELSQVIKVLMGYPELQPAIQREIQWVCPLIKTVVMCYFHYCQFGINLTLSFMFTKSRFANSKFRHISEKEKTHLHDSVLLLDSLIRFKNRMEEKLTMTAVEKLKKEIVQRNLNRTNKILKAKIMEVTKNLKEENGTFNHIYKQKDAVINHHQEELELLKNECVTVIKKKILDSERKMMRDTEAHNTNYENLVEQEREIKEKYEDLLKNHLESEKALRAKRFKIETQLVNWLRKYDYEVGDKQNQLDELTKTYEDEKVALADLQRRFDEQEELYKPLMADKEAEYQVDLAIRVDRFAMNYAAKKVQRIWRDILAREAARRKKKKKGKK